MSKSTAATLGIVVLVAALVIALAAGGVFSGGHHTTTGTTQPTTTPPATSQPGAVKVFAYEPVGISASGAKGVDGPDVAGISWVFRWSTIEPTEGTFDWQPIDTAIAQAEADHKLAMLRVNTGIYSPQWVYSDGAHGVQVSSAHGVSGTMPVPWDAIYLQKLGAFISAFGQRYNGHADVYSVQMPGGGLYGEMILPTIDGSTWQAEGYSDANEEHAWETIITDYRDAFASTPTNLDVDNPIKGDKVALRAIVDWVHATYGSKVWLQQNGLKPGYTNLNSTYPAVLSAASGWTTVGYQMGDGHSPLDTSGLMQAFQAAKAIHASYLEVYPFDLTSQNAGALNYVAAPSS